MKNIAIFGPFRDYLDSYSLCRICKGHMKMLKKAGYLVRYIFRQGGNNEGWKQYLSETREVPDYIADNDGSYSDMENRSGKSLLEMVAETARALEEAIQGIDIIITHDLIYQPSNIIQDMAAAMVSERHPEIKWLHWVHSATTPRALGKISIQKYNNAFICYPNAWDVPRVARNFNMQETQVKVVPHPLDYEEFFDWHPLTTKLIEEKNLMEADAICCYPLRLDRGKQPEIVFEILNQLKYYCKKTIRLIIIDFQSSGGDKVTYRNEMIEKAYVSGWNSKEFTFMSQFDKSCEIETPTKVIRDLFLLSNIYIHPSKSETYSLTTQEARACKNMLVLNFDFPPMMTVYGEGPLYKKFSSSVDMLGGSDGKVDTEYSDRTGYMRDIAIALNYHLQYQDVLRMATETRQNKNMDTIFKKHIEPLFNGDK